MQVEIEAVRAFPRPVTIEMLRADKRSAGMLLLAKGQRLSIQPLAAAHYELVLELAGA
jgi:predicted RNA-binding protein with PUA-like domain